MKWVLGLNEQAGPLGHIRVKMGNAETKGKL